jgi:hypothetical protein
MQHDEKPYENKQSELVEQMMRHHGLASSNGSWRRLFYQVVARIELSAAVGATRWSKGSLGFREDREVIINLVTQLT